mgnify:CR=1 FL=1
MRAEVWLGPGQKLVFVEQASLGQLSDQVGTGLGQELQGMAGV